MSSHSLLPLLQPWSTTDLISVSLNLPILDISHKCSLQSVAFCVWLLLLGIMLSRVIHIVGLTLLL